MTAKSTRTAVLRSSPFSRALCLIGMLVSALRETAARRKVGGGGGEEEGFGKSECVGIFIGVAGTP